MPPATRGFRNNNPGNIDYNPRNQWQGQLPPDPAIEKRFARFDTAENGIRALAKLVLAYRGKDGMAGVGGTGIDTVREVINRWAPGVENDTEAYIKAVAAGVGAQPSQPIDLRNYRTLIAITTGIIKHENGGVPYAPEVIADGVQRALA
ncbi:structural protein P5 [Pseudomonas sp. PS02290]|uniref:structural protein P5 n=1 Tax=Pseudomonas sp. PS02290 TaxID=2991430 RepID=UPI00249B035D|nr:structural protein P5 [Pseudomonas sp. PS02290]